MSAYTGDNGKLIKSTIIGVLSSLAVTALLLCLFALILNFMSGVPYGIIDYAVILAQGLAVFAGSYTAAAISKSQGLIIGLICAAIFLILNLALSLAAGEAGIGIITVIRTAVILICGILGGILGVNKKEKIRIH